MRNVLIILVLSLFASSCFVNKQKRNRIGKVTNYESHCPIDSSVEKKNYNNQKFATELAKSVSLTKEVLISEAKTFNAKEMPLKNSSSQREIGQIVYKVPDTMKVFTSYKVFVRILKDKTINISSDIKGTFIKKDIKVSSNMEVRLVDVNNAFTIIKVNNSLQLVDSLDYTEWVFNVKPIKTGSNSLNLVVSIVIEGVKKEIVYTDQILVLTDVKQQAKVFWYDNWKWLLEKCILPIISSLLTWLITKWWNKRKTKTN